MNVVRSCLVITAFLLLVCCVAYPVVVTGAAQALFPRQANGSLITRGGTVRGSSLLGQTFAHPEANAGYFWGRLSAATVDATTGVTSSSGTNYGPLNPALTDAARARVAALRATGVVGPVPVDLVTASASGLDPDISPAAAAVQVPRVAAARALSEARVRGLVRAHTTGSFLGFVGEPRVNVLELNLDLDAHGAR